MKKVPNLKTEGYVPELSLRTSANEWWNIREQLRRKNIVIYFVHDINCDKCRAHLKAFAQDYRDWGHINSEVVAVLPNSSAELKVLAEALGLPFPLLSDAEGQALAAFTFDQLDQAGPPIVFVVDRLSTLYYHEIDDTADPFEEEKEVLTEVEFLENRTPDTGAFRINHERPA